MRLTLPLSRPRQVTRPRHVAARGTLQLMAAEACVMGCGYLTVIMLARGLGPSAYGVYGLVMSVLIGVELIGRLGIPQALGKLIPEDDTRAPRLERTGLSLSLGISALIFVGFWLSAPAIARLLQIPDGTQLLRLAAIDIPFYGMYFVCDEILGGRRQFGVAAIGAIIYGVGKAVGVALLFFWEISVSGALVVNILASATALTYMALHIPFWRMLPSRDCTAVILRLALPMALYTLGVQLLFSLDLWSLRILGQDLVDETMGLYVAAVNVAKLPSVAAFAITAVLIPSIAGALGRHDQELARRYVQGAVRFLCVVLLPTCLLLALTSEDLLRLLYSTRYTAGAAYLQVLVFGFGLSFAFLSAFCAMLIASGRPLVAASLTLALVPIGLGACSITIPLYGAIGAAGSATLTMVLGAVVAGRLIQRRIGRLVAPSVLARSGLATSCMVLVAWQFSLHGPLLIIEYLLLLGLYVLMLAMLRELTWDDIRPFALWQRQPV